MNEIKPSIGIGRALIYDNLRGKVLTQVRIQRADGTTWVMLHFDDTTAFQVSLDSTPTVQVSLVMETEDDLVTIAENERIPVPEA